MIVATCCMYLCIANASFVASLSNSSAISFQALTMRQFFFILWGYFRPA